MKNTEYVYRSTLFKMFRWLLHSHHNLLRSQNMTFARKNCVNKCTVYQKRLCWQIVFYRVDTIFLGKVRNVWLAVFYLTLQVPSYITESMTILRQRWIVEKTRILERLANVAILSQQQPQIILHQVLTISVNGKVTDYCRVSVVLCWNSLERPSCMITFTISMHLVNPLNFHLLKNIQTHGYLENFYILIDWNKSVASVATAENEMLYQISLLSPPFNL